jgi:hypothetical protein
MFNTSIGQLALGESENKEAFLVVQTSNQTQSTQNVSLNSIHNLDVSNLLQSQNIDGFQVVVNYTALVQNTDQTQFLENIDIIAFNALFPEDLFQSQLLENVELFTIYVLNTQEMNQEQFISNVVFQTGRIWGPAFQSG